MPFSQRVFVLSMALAHRNCPPALLTLHITTPNILAITALLDFPLKCSVATPAAHVCTAPLAGSLRVALSPGSSQCSSSGAFVTIVRRWVQSNEVPGSVSFPSPRSEHVLVTALGLADDVDDVVVFFL